MNVPSPTDGMNALVFTDSEHAPVILALDELQDPQVSPSPFALLYKIVNKSMWLR